MMKGFWNIPKLTFPEHQTMGHSHGMWSRPCHTYLCIITLVMCEKWSYPWPQGCRNESLSQQAAFSGPSLEMSLSQLKFLVDFNPAMLFIFLLCTSLQDIIKWTYCHIQVGSGYIWTTPFSSRNRLSSGLMYHQATVGQMACSLCPKRKLFQTLIHTT